MDDKRVVRLDEIERRPWPTPQRDWGGWHFDPKLRTLTFRSYEVDLDTCTDPAEILDWILQLADKTWLPAEELGNFVRALEDIFDGLQGLVCPFGQARTFDAAGCLVEHYGGV